MAHISLLFFWSPCRKIVLISTYFTCNFLNVVKFGCSHVKAQGQKLHNSCHIFCVGPFATKQALCIARFNGHHIWFWKPHYSVWLPLGSSVWIYILFFVQRCYFFPCSFLPLLCLSCGSHWTSFCELVLDLSFVHPL